MDDPDQPYSSVYDYSDKSVPQAGYAAVVYAAVSFFGGVLAFIQYWLYHRPGTGGLINHEYVSQQWLAHTPLVTAVAVGFSVLIAAVSGFLAFGIFRRSRAAIVAMIVFVILLQLYTWFAARSIAGSILSIVVVAFLLRGAKRMFQDHAEEKLEADKV